MTQMNKNKYSRLPLIFLLYLMFKTFKESLFIYLFILSIFKFINIDFTLGNSIVIVYITVRLIKNYMNWLGFKYKVDYLGISVAKGIINKSSIYIPLRNIKEVNEHRPFFYRLINCSALYIYTDNNKEDGKIILDLIELKEVIRIMNILKSTNHTIKNNFSENEQYSYITSKKEMLISSISPINILIFSIFIYSVLENIDKYLHFKIPIKTVLILLKNNFFLTALLCLPYFALSCIYIYIKTYLKFGEYKVLNTDKEIIIKKGMVNKSNITISKNRIQAVVVKWSLIQKLFGIVQVELITSSDESENENGLKSNLLTPFISKKALNTLLPELFPNLDLNIDLHKLPKISVIFKACSSFIILLIIYFFINKFLNPIKTIYITIAILIIIGKTLEGLFSKYKHTQNIYYKKTNLISSLIIIPSQKVEEFRYTQNYLQRQLNLFSMNIVIRENPAKTIKIMNIPVIDDTDNKRKHIL
ncbi:PH domain-containing protein [Staphylococcus gallinarum]|uniref:PH domain-containing protein n=1 Tax=Staphylococcus gallinarum TaxID=1293 RepID=UPI001E2C6E26|nr:PH domain-containing protein [Staphylococcus gallinarum]MCD8827227.1 PH domain-containing protein [Staphylococcus gallinarum]